ncbi:MAG: tRNA (adenosine(37)-N6)-threonylcarbamoyltransferase complex dimerization subunit type 1 TsaB [bacterium]|nr:tRNA (adenosine(37)-N6)-threonylcarbamoyltransferase complex dimerization subunit type 1 TsaB [bacterium]
MKLFLDTSTSECRLWLDDRYFERELGREMAREILAFIEECLSSVGASYQSLDGIGVFAGPGSFTGLRIGTTVANTLADGLQIPIVSTKNPQDIGSKDSDVWIDIARRNLERGENIKIAMPFYGREARITKPRK